LSVRIVEQAFDPAAELAGFARGRADVGGVASFTGTVRGEHGGTPVLAMTLEHYPGMTEKALAALEAEARARWPLLDTLVVHRVGRMLPGEAIVLVATASAHREAALAACAFLIDWLKTKAPFWKLEATPSGERWVEARASDEARAEAWATSPQPPA
jgi:molybdopterin synthase catalytic subunit